MDLWIYSYSNGSKTAKAIAAELDVKLIKHRDSKFVGDADTFVLNWGCSDLPREVRRCHVINGENAVALSVDKLAMLRHFDGLFGYGYPEYTVDRALAEAWIEEGNSVVCRLTTKGKDGEGIIFASKKEELVDAPLYTLFIPEVRDEYRVTVYRGKIICRQRKVRIPGKEKYDDRFKTTAGGYGFQVLPLVPGEVAAAARDAVDCLGLTFGGVDVLLTNTVPNDVVVLEVNSAPQLTPFALRQFVYAVREEVGIYEG